LLAVLAKALSQPPEYNGRLGQSEIWQILGKMDFYDNSPEEEKALITAYLLVMVGLGGLEPPTSPLSVLGIVGPAPSSHPGNLISSILDFYST
jgi:hypothetical protein